MKRTTKSLVVLGLVLFFASAVLCATLAAPGQSLASVTDCSQEDPAMEMTGCEHPSYLCDFNRSSYLLSQNARSSISSSGSVKSILAVAVGEPCFDSSAYRGAFVGNEHTSAFPGGSLKVPVHLYNSVLHL